MATLVTFHAHPDDEAIATGGTMARASAEGHRVVLIVATDGASGEVPDDLAAGETLVTRRSKELALSAAELGVQRVVELSYADSGMTGWPQNQAPEAFMNIDLDVAARRVAEVLIDEQADVLTIYDWHGNYGHPDHIQVNRVGRRAAELAAERLPHLRVAEATVNRDALARQIQAAREANEPLFGSTTANGEALDDEPDFDPLGPMDDGNPMGMPEEELTLAVDVGAYCDRKRAALACHRSQISDSSFFLQMPPEVFQQAFGTEWYLEHDRKPGVRIGWFFDDESAAT